MYESSNYVASLSTLNSVSTFHFSPSNKCLVVSHFGLIFTSLIDNHYAKPLTVWITIIWKILKEMGLPDHLTCLLRNLHAGQEATVRTGHETMDWIQIGKGVCQGCMLPPCLFNFYAEYMRNTGLEEAQAGIKFAGRNMNNLRYAR